MTELRSTQNLDAIVELAIRRRDDERRRLEEQRAAAARAAAYCTGSTWDDGDWWAKQLGRPAPFGDAAPLREAAPPF